MFEPGPRRGYGQNTRRRDAGLGQGMGVHAMIRTDASTSIQASVCTTTINENIPCRGSPWGDAYVDAWTITNV
jgi:hypothetical protein